MSAHKPHESSPPRKAHETREPQASHGPHGIIDHDRIEFQVDRLILFTDAVFAIAITLLIIEIKVPEEAHHAHRGYEIWHALLAIVPRFTGFVFSFLLIGVYWMAHHHLFRYVINYNGRLIWLNLILLMFVVCMPFTTALAFETFTDDVDVSFILYSLNHIFISLSFLLLWKYISNPAHRLSSGLTDKKYIRYNYWRSFSIIIVFGATIVLGFLKPSIARFTPILCSFAIPLVNRRFKLRR